MLPRDSGPLPRGVGTHLNFSIFLGIKTGCLGAIAIFVLYKKCKRVSAPTALQGRINRIDIVQINWPCANDVIMRPWSFYGSLLLLQKVCSRNCSNPLKGILVQNGVFQTHC